MKSKGFSFSRNNYYYINNDIAYCVAFEIPCALLYVTAYIMPLYIPSECIYYTYGNRLNVLKGIELPLLRRDSDEKEIDEWCAKFFRCMEDYVIPFYKKIDTPNRLLESFEKKSGYLQADFSCPEVFSARLMMYTWLYLGDTLQAKLATKRFYEILEANTLLTNRVRQKYLDEVVLIRSLNQKGESAVQGFCLRNIANTKRFFVECHKSGNGPLPYDRGPKL